MLLDSLPEIPLKRKPGTWEAWEIDAEMWHRVVYLCLSEVF